jgi:hypothetical protein
LVLSSLRPAATCLTLLFPNYLFLQVQTPLFSTCTTRPVNRMVEPLTFIVELITRRVATGTGWTVNAHGALAGALWWPAGEEWPAAWKQNFAVFQALTMFVARHLRAAVVGCFFRRLRWHGGGRRRTRELLGLTTARTNVGSATALRSRANGVTPADSIFFRRSPYSALASADKSSSRAPGGLPISTSRLGWSVIDRDYAPTKRPTSQRFGLLLTLLRFVHLYCLLSPLLRYFVAVGLSICWPKVLLHVMTWWDLGHGVQRSSLGPCPRVNLNPPGSWPSR